MLCEAGLAQGGQAHRCGRRIRTPIPLLLADETPTPINGRYECARPAGAETIKRNGDDGMPMRSSVRRETTGEPRPAAADGLPETPTAAADGRTRKIWAEYSPVEPGEFVQEGGGVRRLVSVMGLVHDQGKPSTRTSAGGRAQSE